MTKHTDSDRQNERDRPVLEGEISVEDIASMLCEALRRDDPDHNFVQVTDGYAMIDGTFNVLSVARTFAEAFRAKVLR